MLNEDFEGGGTLMDCQLQLDEGLIKPLKPAAAGHALIHESRQRHAGVGTTSGTRDILVLFVTATHPSGKADFRERAARLKGKAALTSRDSLRDSLRRLFLYRLAIDVAPDDGEAWHYLGMALNRYSSELASVSQLAAAALTHAITLTPNDARVYNNLALVMERLQSASTEQDSIIQRLYEKSLDLHQRAKSVGCDVEIDMDTAALNYGLFLANRDRFQAAVGILSLIDCDSIPANGENLVKENSLKLMRFCKQQLY
jgi:tetratricopeptide (TPR) repeat protein